MKKSFFILLFLLATFLIQLGVQAAISVKNNLILTAVDSYGISEKEAEQYFVIKVWDKAQYLLKRQFNIQPDSYISEYITNKKEKALIGLPSEESVFTLYLNYLASIKLDLDELLDWRALGYTDEMVAKELARTKKILGPLQQLNSNNLTKREKLLYINLIGQLKYRLIQLELVQSFRQIDLYRGCKGLRNFLERAGETVTSNIDAAFNELSTFTFADMMHAKEESLKGMLTLKKVYQQLGFYKVYAMKQSYEIAASCLAHQRPAELEAFARKNIIPAFCTSFSPKVEARHFSGLMLIEKAVPPKFAPHDTEAFQKYRDICIQ